MNLYLLTNEKYRDNNYLDVEQADPEGQWAGFLVAADSPQAAKTLARVVGKQLGWDPGLFDGWRVKLVSNRKRPGVILAV